MKGAPVVLLVELRDVVVAGLSLVPIFTRREVLAS